MKPLQSSGEAIDRAIKEVIKEREQKKDIYLMPIYKPYPKVCNKIKCFHSNQYIFKNRLMKLLNRLIVCSKNYMKKAC